MDRLPDVADRASDPAIRVEDLAWLEFEKPDLDAAERFAHDFGFMTAARDDRTLYLRGSLPGTHALVVFKGERSRFLAPVFRAASLTDLAALAEAERATVTDRRGLGGGYEVELADPDGAPVRVVADVATLPAARGQDPLVFNTNSQVSRVNAGQRPPLVPSRIERLGHVVLERPSLRRTLQWYLDRLGMIVSDYQHLPGQSERGPSMAFVRCDRGSTPTDHHTLAMSLGPRVSYVHSAFQVCDLDALAAGGEYLRDKGYKRSWGIGRHVQGSQIFDYWRDPDGLMFEHFTDGDLFDNTVEAGWSEMSASGLAQWGPRATRDFLGLRPDASYAKSVVSSIRDDQAEFDRKSLSGLIKVANR